VVNGVAGLAEYSGKLSLQLLGGEWIAAFPDIHLLSHQMVHAYPHSTDYAYRYGINILFFQGTKKTFHGIL